MEIEYAVQCFDAVADAKKFTARQTEAWQVIKSNLSTTATTRVEICPCCSGSGVPRLQLRFGESCSVCKGTGKLSPIA